MRSTRGFSLIELLTVMLVIGVLASIALLKYIDLRNAARSAAVAGDFRTVMVAAYNYYADHNDWPPEAPAGVVPPQIVPYLRTGFDFVQPAYTLDYDNVPMGGPYMIGVTVTTADPDLMKKLVRYLGANVPFYASGGSLTYVIVDGTGGG